MPKYRSKVNYAQIYGGDEQGINLGLDGALFLRKEASPRVFNPPRVGTQGSSTGDIAASTDISAGTDVNLKVSVDGGAVVDVALTAAGANTGDGIAAELESKINTALAAAGQDARVWGDFDSGDDHYTVYSQYTGLASSVVITDGDTDNVADDLKLGVPNGGTEAAGTDDQDFLLYSTGGPVFNQPIESNPHRSGRYHVGIIKQKKVAEFSFQTFVNMSGSAGDSIDTAVRLLWEQLLGTETVNPNNITYTQGLPNFYMSMVRVSTIFGEYYTGGYVKEMDLNFPGDGPATCDWSGMAEKRTIAGIASIDGVVSASAVVGVVAGQHERYDEGARVMIVSADGRTITAGQAGDLLVNDTDIADQLTLSAAVDAENAGFVVPWHPGAVQQTGRDAIFTDLVGSFKMRSTSSNICVTSINLNFNNDHVDRNACFGQDANFGFVAANRLTMALAVEFDLSNDNYSDVVQSSKFAGFDPEIVLGDESSGRYLKITAPNWIPAVPPIELPENGTTPVTLEGNLYQSQPGAQDPITALFG